MRSLALLAVVLLLGCPEKPPSNAALGAPGDVQAERMANFTNASYTVAPGDTLNYIGSWTAGARAQGYLVTTSVTQGSGWSGLLTNAPTTALSMPFKMIHPTAWDSAGFRLCVVSTAPGKSNSSPSCVDWKIVRGPGSPGIPGIDSSQVIAAIILKPDAVTLVANVGTQQFCPYARALDGKVRFISGYENIAECQSHYDAMPSGDRLPGYPVAVSYKQEWFNIDVGPKVITVAVRPPQQELLHTMFGGPFT